MLHKTLILKIIKLKLNTLKIFLQKKLLKNIHKDSKYTLV